MFRSSLPRRGLPSPAARLLRAVPRPAGLALAAVTAAALAAAVPAVPASAASGACTASSGQVTCTFTEGSAQTWTVPAGIMSATFTLYGAEGGSGTNYGGAGLGAEVTATLTVTPGTVLQVNVGQVGAAGGVIGASYGGGGGGASDIRTPASDGTYPLANRVLVAGGGGGGGRAAVTTAGGYAENTGGGGGNADSKGGPAGNYDVAGAIIGGGGGGGAATTTGPGSAGTAGQMTDSTSCFGVNGVEGNPGVGAAGASPSIDGGGGGDGYYGGGSGGSGAAGGTSCGGYGAVGGYGGGGGGSSYPVTDVVGDAAAPGQSGNGEVIITFTVPTLMVTTASLPEGVVGASYSQQVAATGGLAPYTWSVSSGSLPPGLNLSSPNGTTETISGTPTTPGTYTFTLQVTDSVSETATSQTLSITVNPVLAVKTTSLPAATGGQAYNVTLAATGGIPPYGNWSVSSGSLPPGLTLNSPTGKISGTPDVAGTYTFTVTVTDSENPAMTATATLSITVSGPVITGLRPDRGPFFGLTPVLITGTGLSCPPGQRGCRVTVTFGQRRALVVLDRPAKIWVLSPAGSGTVPVTVTVGGVSSQPATFTYLRFL
jgi:hypothetical protein